MSEQPPAGPEAPLGAVYDAIQGLRREMHLRLQRSSEELLQLVERFAHEMPPPEPEPVATAALAEEVPGPNLATLRGAVAAIDAADSQSEVLARLLEQSTAFASRAALFLAPETEPGSLRGWTAIGFDDGGGSVEGVELAPPTETPWMEVGTGQGTLLLSAGDCALLCSRIEAPLPRQGVLVPLVLRDRVSAVLYADHTQPDDAFSVDALQMLTYTAAQALEVLPLRTQHWTGTLVVAPTAGAEPVPEDAASQEAFAEPIRPESIEPVPTEPLPLEPELAEPALAEPLATAIPVDTDAFESVIEPPVEPAWTEPQAESQAEALVEPTPAIEPIAVEPTPVTPEALDAPLVDTPRDAEPAVPEASPEDLLPEAERRAGFVVEELEEIGGAFSAEPVSQVPSWSLEDAPAAPAAEPAHPPTAGLADDDAQFDLIESTAAETGVPTAEIPLPETPTPAESWELESETPAVQAELTELPPEEVISPLVGGPPMPAPAQVPPPEPSPVDSVLPETETSPLRPEGSVLEEMQTQAALEDAETQAPAEPAAAGALETQLVSSQEIPTIEVPPPVAPPSPAPPPPAEVTTPSGEVVPPRDITGPGLAFQAEPEPPTSGEEPLHEEARRLARLLVSEIKLYNEEQIEEGRRQGNIYDQLREDIDRSRQMYEERIDERVRVSSDYFRDELITSLAGGDANVMGL